MNTTPTGEEPVLTPWGVVSGAIWFCIGAIAAVVGVFIIVGLESFN